MVQPRICLCAKVAECDSPIKPVINCGVGGSVTIQAQGDEIHVIERCFVEVRRRTRPMVCFVNVESVDRIIYSIFQRFNLEWKIRTLNLFTQAA